MKIWTVDAFANKPYSGNPAAVMILSEFPADDLVQQIASEMNLSETAFVKPLKDGAFHIRWFTPSVEVKLCGHATLAAAHILFQQGFAFNNFITLASLSGPLMVTKNADLLTLDFPLQKTGLSLGVEVFVQQLKITKPVIAVVQAYDDVILELADPRDVFSLALDATDVAKLDCRGLIVTAKGNEPYDFISRFFAPRVGVDEDPVTGSAHCKLADYWQQKLKKDSFFAFQASKRGGEIHVSIKQDRVLLTGKAITVMEGNWLVYR